MCLIIAKSNRLQQVKNQEHLSFGGGGRLPPLPPLTLLKLGANGLKLGC